MSLNELATTFRSPPAGFGEVPFWWWNGDRLDPVRLRWQLDQLAGRGVSGVQVNLAHAPHGGGGYGLTYPCDPPVFSPAWWQVWDGVVDDCAARDLRIGMSDYTLAWPGNGQWSDRIAADPAFRGAVLEHRISTPDAAGLVALDLPFPALSLRAYPLRDGHLDAEHAMTLTAGGTWQAPSSDWQVVAVWAKPVERSLDPLHPDLGRRVVEEHFQRFADRLPAEAQRALDYFFQDELLFGLGDGRPWSAHLPVAFRTAHGYDLLAELPALFADLGPRSAKLRLDLAETAVSLMEAGYFRPIHEWHAARGMTYGCDQIGRGTEPCRYGDYMRAIRWFSAPGHDTPGVGADLVKGKVSSSIAHLNRRPRVWLEGYHSAGWGMEPQRILAATLENFAYGCSLLSLHGLYYSTHGSHWEWAPPCYHFRMPYWEHFATGLRGVERLSWLLTRGVHRCDVAVLYPVAALDAGLADSPEPAFAVMRELVTNGCDADFIDDGSLAVAVPRAGVLSAADEQFRVLVLADLPAIRHASLTQAVAFAAAGGLVLLTGRLPLASERSGAGDAEVERLVRLLVGCSAAEAVSGIRPGPQRHANGGVSQLVEDPACVRAAIDRGIRRDCVPDQPMLVLHRHLPEVEVLFLVKAPAGSAITVQAVGPVELWDPWSGTMTRLESVSVLDDGRQCIRLPDEATPHASWVLVIDTTVGRHGVGAVIPRLASPRSVTLDGPWEFALVPTMDNRWGDFRLPISETMIGVEARSLRISTAEEPDDGWRTSVEDSSQWRDATCGFGPQFLVAGLPAGLVPDTSSTVPDPRLAWCELDFSWRWGPEGDPGTQGYHGLKGMVSDEVIALGDASPVSPMQWQGATRSGDVSRLLWTQMVAPGGAMAEVIVGGLVPQGIWLAGQPIHAGDLVQVADGAVLLIAYATAGRGHVVLRQPWAPAPRQVLATRWWCDPAVLLGDPEVGNRVLRAHCLVPPATTAVTLTVHGEAELWLAGRALPLRETGRREDGARTLVAEIERPCADAAQLALRLHPPRGYAGLAALPEPVRLTTGDGGRLVAGDWSAWGVLRDYSGTAWYRRTLMLSATEAAGRTWLDLGAVGVSAAVLLNGERLGVLLAAPWRIELTGHVRPGVNRLEIEVANTLANHYRTIPTRYGGPLISGLLGPVRLEHG